MDQWYYTESGEQRGPVSERDLRDLLTTNRISTTTLVWREGMPEWTPAESLATFAPSPYATPVSGSSPEIDWTGYTPSGSQVRPWVRYWARTADFISFSMVLAIALAAALPEWLDSINDTLFGIILLFLYCFVEPVFFALWGTTPFKALLQIRVRNGDGSRLSFPQALSRSLQVWARGNGLGIPVVALIANLISLSRLRENGITPWDASGHFTVSHRKIEWWRWLLVLSPLIVFVGLVFLGIEAQ